MLSRESKQVNNKCDVFKVEQNRGEESGSVLGASHKPG